MTKVLVIDDDDIARELIVSILQSAGFSVFDLPSPIGATRSIVDNEVTVVVLDLLMPVLSGDKLTKMLRSNPRLSNLVIVLVSSSDLNDLRRLAVKVNANAVVPKSQLRKELVPAIKDAIRRNS
jgi:CheY-like chemotaxis protein